MSTLYEIVELANGDIALQKESDSKKRGNGAPLVTMRFSTDLLRFLRGAKMDIAKVMIEAGLERVAHLAESLTREELEAKIDTFQRESADETKITRPVVRSARRNMTDRRLESTSEYDDQHPTVSHLLH